MTHPNIPGMGLPGLLPVQDQESVKFLLDNNHFMRKGIKVDKDTDDNSQPGGKEHKLKGGLVLVRVEAGGNKNKFVDAQHPNAPAAGSIVQAVILMESFSLFDHDGTREDKTASGLIHGRVDESLINFGTADGPTIAAIKAALKLVQFEKLVP